MIWFDGALHATTTQPFDLADRGLTLADGLFETITVFGGVPFRSADHLARLEAAAAVLGFAAPLAEAVKAVAALAAHAEGGRGVIRLTVTRGSGPRGLKPPADPVPSVFATLAPWNPAIAFVPVRLATAAIRRNETSPVARLKSLAYLDNVLAFAAAQAAGADDALMLNTAGRAASSTMANLFVVRNGTVLTPPRSEGVLDGIMRGLLLRHGADAGLDCRESPVTLEMIVGADEIFLTNSVRVTLPVTSVDGHPIAAGPIAEAAYALFRHLIREECGDAF